MERLAQRLAVVVSERLRPAWRPPARRLQGPVRSRLQDGVRRSGSHRLAALCGEGKSSRAAGVSTAGYGVDAVFDSAKISPLVLLGGSSRSPVLLGNAA